MTLTAHPTESRPRVGFLSATLKTSLFLIP